MRTVELSAQIVTCEKELGALFSSSVMSARGTDLSDGQQGRWKHFILDGICQYNLYDLQRMSKVEKNASQRSLANLCLKIKQYSSSDTFLGFHTNTVLWKLSCVQEGKGFATYEKYRLFCLFNSSFPFKHQNFKNRKLSIFQILQCNDIFNRM